MQKLSNIESIGCKFTELLEKSGIEDQQQLLDACYHREGRETLANKTGINPKLILKWTNQADLARINGIGQEYAELLGRSGAENADTLAQWNPEKLLAIMQDINKQYQLVRQSPSLTQVTSWIEQAKILSPRVKE